MNIKIRKEDLIYAVAFAGTVYGAYKLLNWMSKAYKESEENEAQDKELREALLNRKNYKSLIMEKTMGNLNLKPEDRNLLYNEILRDYNDALYSRRSSNVEIYLEKVDTWFDIIDRNNETEIESWVMRIKAQNEIKRRNAERKHEIDLAKAQSHAEIEKARIAANAERDKAKLYSGSLNSVASILKEVK